MLPSSPTNSSASPTKSTEPEVISSCNAERGPYDYTYRKEEEKRDENREIRCKKKDLRKKYIGTRLPDHIRQESHIANHHPTNQKICRPILTFEWIELISYSVKHLRQCSSGSSIKQLSRESCERKDSAFFID
jgi:hypothetical protein